MKHNNEISMKRIEVYMKWIEVYDEEREGPRKVIGYVCSRCGFFTRQKFKGGCPFCKRPELDE